MMRAARLVAPRRFELQRLAPRHPDAGEVLVKLRGCGLCASSLPVWQGRPWFEYPLAPGMPGHEGWGRIEAVGEGVDAWAVGTPVALLTQQSFATHDVARVDQLVRIPAPLADEAFPGEPLGCAMNIFRRSEVQAGERVAVVGVGFMGALLVQLCARAGAEVIAFARRPWAQQVAGAMGAREVVPWDAELAAGRTEPPGVGSCARVIECVGTQSALDLASRLVAERSRLIVAGYHQDGLRQVNLQQWNWQGIDVINAHERDPAVYVAGMRAAADAVASGRLTPAPLLTHAVPLNAIDEGFALLEERPDGFMKAYITLSD